MDRFIIYDEHILDNQTSTYISFYRSIIGVKHSLIDAQTIRRLSEGPLTVKKLSKMLEPFKQEQLSEKAREFLKEAVLWCIANENC